MIPESERGQTPHLPRPAPIDSYGNGGFRFAGMSHRGSLLCLPSGIWAWPVSGPADISETSLAPIFAEADALDFVLLGTGATAWTLPEALAWRFRDHRLRFDTLSTGAALRTYNIVLAEGRRAGAGLIAVP